MEKKVARKIAVDKAPNRLFIKYLTKYKDEAKERGDNSRFTYGRALKSMKKYPLPLQSGKEAIILEHCGDKICKMLDKSLEKEADENGMSAEEFLAKSRKVPESWWKKVNQAIPVPAVTKKPAKRKKVLPNQISPKKGKIVQSTLDKDLRLSAETSTMPSLDSQHDSASSISTYEDTFSLLPGEFEVVLCVDTRETMREKRKNDIKLEMEREKVNYEQRTLNLGDFLWIAREKSDLCFGREPRELVLDFIIERKVLSDLATSIQDGRFREQKMRLKNSGLKNVIYLIENIGQIGNQRIPELTLRQAIYNTQIIDKIAVKYTKNAKSTVLYLDIMTKQLQKLYKNHVLTSLGNSDSQDSQENLLSGKSTFPTFHKFNEAGAKKKKLTVKELFLRQLMQIHGMSYDKAFSVTSIYETPSLLIQKYDCLETEAEKEALLSKIKTGLTGRNLGIAMSRSIYKVFS